MRPRYPVLALTYANNQLYLDVDDGSTVTDFLPAERARGITIQSAAITFHWPPLTASPPLPSKDKQDNTDQWLSEPPKARRSSVPHTINLIDTPGHADFTFEVVRSLRVLDGAVCILDGVAGVEAQTEKVWTQAANHQIPRIIYVNKLDRDGAAFGKTVRDVATRLKGWPAVCQIPWWSERKDKLIGVGDAINLRGLRWKGGDGRAIDALDLKTLNDTDPPFAAELRKARVALVELLSEHDDEIVEAFFACEEDHLAIQAMDILNALRNCVLRPSQIIIPIFAGASFRNVGVQPLLDSVVELLPSPIERPDPEIGIGNSRGGLMELIQCKPNMLTSELQGTDGKKKKKGAAKAADKLIPMVQHLECCALAFKVVNEARRGVLVYVRIYSGSIRYGSLLFNTNLQVSEKVPRLFRMYASDAVEVSALHEGEIGVITGLRHARTGDTLIVYSGKQSKHGPPSPFNTLQLRPIEVPPPVFFTSIEPHSLSEEKHLSDMLAIVLREDPSLNVTIDPESGQTHLAGMGELHLEIARDRLIEDFKVKASAGKIQIGYREAILAASAACTETFDRRVANKDVKAACTASILPLRDDVAADSDASESFTNTSELPDSNYLFVTIPNLDPEGQPLSDDGPALPSDLTIENILTAFRAGTSVALARGLQHLYAIHSAHVRLTFDLEKHLFSNTNLSALTNAARLAVRAALKSAVASYNGGSFEGSVLMEPVMKAIITVNERHLGPVVQDLSAARGAQVLSLDGELDVDADTESSSNSSAGAGTTTSSTAVTSSPTTSSSLSPIDLSRVYAPPDPFGPIIASTSFSPSSSPSTSKPTAISPSTLEDNPRQIVARVPLKEMVGYLKHLRSLTGGRGTFVMSFDRFERMSLQRQRLVLAEGLGEYHHR